MEDCAGDMIWTSVLASEMTLREVLFIYSTVTSINFLCAYTLHLNMLDLNLNLLQPGFFPQRNID